MHRKLNFTTDTAEQPLIGYKRLDANELLFVVTNRKKHERPPFHSVFRLCSIKFYIAKTVVTLTLNIHKVKINYLEILTQLPICFEHLQHMLVLMHRCMETQHLAFFALTFYYKIYCKAKNDTSCIQIGCSLSMAQRNISTTA